MPSSGSPLAVRDLISEAGSLKRARAALELAHEMGIHSTADLAKARLRSDRNGVEYILAEASERIGTEDRKDRNHR